MFLSLCCFTYIETSLICWLVMLYGIFSLVGYLMPNPVCMYVLVMYYSLMICFLVLILKWARAHLFAHNYMIPVLLCNSNNSTLVIFFANNCFKYRKYEPPHMDDQKQNNQLEPTHDSSVPIQDVALKTYLK